MFVIWKSLWIIIAYITWPIANWQLCAKNNENNCIKIMKIKISMIKKSNFNYYEI